MNAVKTVKRYFELSNDSDFDGITQLLSDRIIYDSQNTGIHSGIDDVVSMQKAFHQQFTSINWATNGVKETRPSVIIVDYDFTGEKLNGEKVSSSGLETITVKNARIIRIEIRNK